MSQGIERLMLEDGTIAVICRESKDEKFWLVDVLHTDLETAKNLQVRKEDFEKSPTGLLIHKGIGLSDHIE